MQSALAFLAFSSLGVMFGWQPMPDGSPQYEYVVQIEPELLATMKEGTTIPISSEVPDHIRPIARIRITVGSGELPRETLPTDVKLWPEGESRAGLLETQYIQPLAGQSTAPRYQNEAILPPDNNSNQILPPTSRSQQADNGFGQTLQRSAEQARSTASPRDILPPTNEIRPAQSPTGFSQPLETANERSGNQSDIGRLFGPGPTSSQSQVQPVDDRSSPTGDRYVTQGGERSILPPARTTPSTADDWRANERSTVGDRYERLDEPITAAAGDQRAAAATASAPGVFNAPWPPLERFTDAPLAQEWNSRNAQDSRSPAQPVSSGVNPAAWPDTRTSSSAFDVAERTSPSGTRPIDDTLNFPAAQTGNNSPNNSDRPQSPPPTPEIRRDMLSRPADAELVTASGDPVRPTAESPPVSDGFPPPAQPQQSTTPTTLASQPATEAAPSTTNNSKAFPLLLAWVLLSGSGAGNLYLFWSYLDIRHKYRGLVRTARRKLGKRIHDEIDDEDYED